VRTGITPANASNNKNKSRACPLIFLRQETLRALLCGVHSPADALPGGNEHFLLLFRSFPFFISLLFVVFLVL
jgi:hypothetical protein